jgi:hypothetical protein
MYRISLGTIILDVMQRCHEIVIVAVLGLRTVIRRYQPEPDVCTDIAVRRRFDTIDGPTPVPMQEDTDPTKETVGQQQGALQPFALDLPVMETKEA